MTISQDDIENKQIKQLVTNNNDRIEALKNLINKVHNIKSSDKKELLQEDKSNESTNGLTSVNDYDI